MTSPRSDNGKAALQAARADRQPPGCRGRRQAVIGQVRGYVSPEPVRPGRRDGLRRDVPGFAMPIGFSC